MVVKNSMKNVPYYALKYLYYRIYAWNLRVWGESDLPQYNALFGVSFLLFLNMLSILATVEVFVGEHLIQDSNFTKFVLAGVIFVVFVVNFLCLVHDRKYMRIVKEFSDESATQRKGRLIALWIYVIGSFIAFFAVIGVRNS